jgi:hypothetical protein
MRRTIMLKKDTIIHIMDASDKILFNKDDAEMIHFILNQATEADVNRCYQAYLKELLRQCRA